MVIDLVRMCTTACFSFPQYVSLHIQVLWKNSSQQETVSECVSVGGGGGKRREGSHLFTCSESVPLSLSPSLPPSLPPSSLSPSLLSSLHLSLSPSPPSLLIPRRSTYTATLTREAAPRSPLSPSPSSTPPQKEKAGKKISGTGPSGKSSRRTSNSPAPSELNL